MLAVAAVGLAADPDLAPRDVARAIAACYALVEKLEAAEAESDYQVAHLLEATREYGTDIE
jgi:hypothetical protein